MRTLNQATSIFFFLLLLLIYLTTITVIQAQLEKSAENRQTQQQLTNCTRQCMLQSLFAQYSLPITSSNSIQSTKCT